MKYKFDRMLVANIIDMFEDFLDEKGVKIPNDERDRDDPDNTANIYGEDFDKLADGIVDTLRNYGITVGEYRPGEDAMPTLFEICEVNGEKYIHYSGYGYYSETGVENDPTPYRIVEYCGVGAPLKEVLEFEKKTGESYEAEVSCEFNQYVTDCTLEELIEAYDTWFDGRAPQPLPEQGLTEDIPYGCYYMDTELYII